MGVDLTLTAAALVLNMKMAFVENPLEVFHQYLHRHRCCYPLLIPLHAVLDQEVLVAVQFRLLVEQGRHMQDFHQLTYGNVVLELLVAGDQNLA